MGEGTDGKKMLYIMGIDWDWIYQRPQILGELLSNDYEVTVLCPRSILKKWSPGVERKDINIQFLWTLPYQEKNCLIARLSGMINKKKLEKIRNYPYIYIGYPLYGRYIPEDYTGKIIYDCMDNHDALYPDRKRVAEIIKQERILAERADLIIASSRVLADKMNSVTGEKRCRLIRNGVEIKKIYGIEKAHRKKTYKVGYIGTIAKWFDYELLLESQKELQQISYHLAGPCDNTVKSDGIFYEGVVPHSALYDVVKGYDCLIMPFKINDIVESVDPVKLYEYIAFGKCIVSVWYKEIERFEEFVYFYRNVEEYVVLMKRLIMQGFPVKYGREQQIHFLRENCWGKRYESLKRYIDLMEVD